MPELPVLIPMDTYRPNMERIVLIQKDALVCNKNELGRGAFGVVFAGYWIPPGKQLKVPVAIKVVKDPTGKANQEMVEEATKMTMLRHEHLLRIVGVCMSGEDLQLVTLLRPLGNLLRFLQKNRTYLGGKELMVYAYQIASGMKYLAENRVVHRDLAARNVLVKNTQHVEITDFGLAKMIDFDKDSVQVGEGKVAIKWLALECLEKQVYTTSSDVWAFGVTVWEILTYGDSPYVGKSPQQIKDHLIGGQRLAQPNNCSTELYSTLLQCWMGNPDSRPPFAMLKEIFYNYCRAPHAFVVDPLMRNGKLEIGTSQRELIEEIIDETDFEDPQHYFDSEPNTPGVFGSGDSSFPNSMRRMDSTTSGTRYASDPMGGGLQQVGMEDDNYLIPTSKVGEGVSMYTPVVVNEHGQTALVASKNYYNEIVPESEYLNETKSMVKAAAVKRREHSRDARAPALSAIEEDDYPMERESCL